MLVYEDVFSKQELVSDAFRMCVRKISMAWTTADQRVTHRTEVGDIAYEVECTTNTIQNNVDYNIGMLHHRWSLSTHNRAGANPSAEEAPAETSDQSSVQTLQIVESFRLQPISLNKGDYVSHIKV